MFIMLTPHLNRSRTITNNYSFFLNRKVIMDQWRGCTTVPAKTVRWASALLNTAIQFHTPKQRRAPMSTRLIDGWHRRGERGRRRWTLRTLPQPQLSCQLPLTHLCQLWPWWSRPAKENSPSLHLKQAVSLYLTVSLPRSSPSSTFLVRRLASQADGSAAPGVRATKCPQSRARSNDEAWSSL